MPNWSNLLSPSSPNLRKNRAAMATPIAELREHYDSFAATFGSAPNDLAVEPAQLGQVKGEWVRVDESEPERLLLYLHGGGFISGAPAPYRPLIGRLCKAAGAAALSLDYRLAPEFPFPAGLRDAVDCYRFLIGKGLSAQSIVLAGDGAGGGLAFATLMAIRNAGMPMPAGCIAMSPWADLALSGWSILENGHSDAALSWDLLFASARHYLKGSNPGDPYASPVFGNMRDFPPIMVHAGSLEILRDDAGRLGDLAAKAEIPVSIEVYDGMPHVFQGSPLASEAKVSLGRLGQFVRTRTSAGEAKVVSKSAKSGS
jgi:monoterpene epsilon-lactone hydrolase